MNRRIMNKTITEQIHLSQPTSESLSNTKYLLSLLFLDWLSWSLSELISNDESYSQLVGSIFHCIIFRQSTRGYLEVLCPSRLSD
jgi:hypothetical protein